MSNPRAKWWGYIRRVLYDYPRLRAELDERQRAMQSKGEQVCRGNGIGRPAEALALAVLPDAQEQRELEAVEAALLEADELTRRLVVLVFFKRTHTLQGAALRLHISYETAKRRQQGAIRSVAEKLGLAET